MMKKSLAGLDLDELWIYSLSNYADGGVKKKRTKFSPSFLGNLRMCYMHVILLVKY